MFQISISKFFRQLRICKRRLTGKFFSKRQSVEGNNGFTLLELIITLFVMSILVMGTIPLTQNAAKRQKELRLRETLRVIRNAIDEFHRDTIGACPQGALSASGGNINSPGNNRVGNAGRSKISDRQPPLIREAAW